MGLQDRDYMKKKPSKGGKTVKNESHNVNQRQKDVILIGGGLIIYGLLTHPERLLPIAVEIGVPIKSL